MNPTLALRFYLEQTKLHGSWLDVTNLTPEAGGFAEVSSSDGYAFKDDEQGWVSNSAEALELMASILNPTDPSPALKTALKLRDMSREARRNNEYFDVSNLKDDGTGCTFFKAGSDGFPPIQGNNACWSTEDRFWCATYDQYKRYFDLRNMIVPNNVEA